MPMLQRLVSDSHLPLYFIILAGWIKLFGLAEYGLRLLSVIISLLGFWAFFVFARKLFNLRIAFISILLLMFSSFFLMFSQEIRMYGLMFLFSTLSSYYLWILTNEKNTWPNGLKYLLSALALALTHVFGILILAAQGIYWIYLLSIKKSSKTLRIGLWPILAGALASPMYFILLRTNLAAVATGASDMPYSVFPFYFKAALFGLVFALGETVAPWHWLATVPAALIFAALIILSLRKLADQKIVFLSILFFFPLVVAALVKPTMPKYLLEILPFFLLLSAVGFDSIRANRMKLTLLTILAFISFISISNYFHLREYHNTNQAEPWRLVEKSVVSQAKEGDLIIASGRFVVYRVMDYYLSQEKENKLPVVTLEGLIPPTSESGLVYDGAGKPIAFEQLEAKRIWLVTHILDDRAFPPGFVESFKTKLDSRYQLTERLSFVPYDSTLSAQLAKKRHQIGAYRISVGLYVRR